MGPETEMDIIVCGAALMLGYPLHFALYVADLVHDSHTATVREAIASNEQLATEYHAGGDIMRILDFVKDHSYTELV